ncbi:MAG: arsenate reductase (glutaredoxin) [Cytophagales bacterium]|nr:arsenate reductase (glutaredoxin) [Cytophagales bacterium]
MVEIYHNTRCRKSRETLALLEEKETEIQVIEYLKTPPSKEELQAVLSKLGIPAFKLIRKTEAIYKEEYKGKYLSEGEWVEAMLTHPKLIERPIVIKGDRAVIGRPPENIEDLF